MIILVAIILCLTGVFLIYSSASDDLNKQVDEYLIAAYDEEIKDTLKMASALGVFVGLICLLGGIYLFILG